MMYGPMASTSPPSITQVTRLTFSPLTKVPKVEPSSSTIRPSSQRTSA